MVGFEVLGRITRVEVIAIERHACCVDVARSLAEE